MINCPQYSAIVFDLGDVLFKWSAETRTSITPKALRRILSCPTWLDYERGRISERDCYDRVGAEFGFPPTEIREAFEQARDSLVPSYSLVELIRELKAQARVKVYAMSNISSSDWDVLRKKSLDWSIFDQVFTSGLLGERKPDLAFYRHVIAQTGLDPRNTIFVDDKHENVLSARSLGFFGIVFNTEEGTRRALRNLIGDPVSRAKAYLEANARNLHSVTAPAGSQPSIVLRENFAQLLILELTGNRALVDLVEHEQAWNFFHHGEGILTTAEFPFDVDTTSIALTVLKRDSDVANSVMDEMLQYVNTDGIMQTYFDHNRPRFDPIVCVNALSLFYMHGRGAELSKTLKWVHEVLLNRAYLDGTRYYEHPECFLWCISRLLSGCPDAHLHSLLLSLLRDRVQELTGSDGDALQLAMRIVVCDFVGIRDEIDLRALLPLQCEDGSFEAGWIYKYGSSGLRIGNKGLTTAMAVKAIEVMNRAVAPPITPTSPASPTIVSGSPPDLTSKEPVPATPASSPPDKEAPGYKRLPNLPIKLNLPWLLPGRGPFSRKAAEIVHP